MTCNTTKLGCISTCSPRCALHTALSVIINVNSLFPRFSTRGLMQTLQKCIRDAYPRVRQLLKVLPALHSFNTRIATRRRSQKLAQIPPIFNIFGCRLLNLYRRIQYLKNAIE